MKEGKNNKNKNQEQNEECPLCKISEETIKKLEKADKNKSPKKPNFFQKIFAKIIAAISLVGGVIVGGLGIIGIAGLCCLPLIAGILAIFGISSIVLMAYGKIFIAISVLLIGVAIVLFLLAKKRRARK